MSDQPKLYVPKCNLKRHTFQNGSSIVKLNVTNVDDFCAFLQANKSEKGWINLVVAPRKEEGRFGETHTLFVDTWKKEQSSEAKPAQQSPF